MTTPGCRPLLAADTTFESFFAEAELNPNASSITGTVCGVRVEDVDDPLMQKIRDLDKLVDELAKGRAHGEGPPGMRPGPQARWTTRATRERGPRVPEARRCAA